MNLQKTKVMALSRSPLKRKDQDCYEYPCSVCSKGVGSNSIKCRTFDLWCHKRCSGLQSLKKIEDTFECPTCSCSRRLTEKPPESCLRVDGGKLDMVDDFCYFGCDEL